MMAEIEFRDYADGDFFREYEKFSYFLPTFLALQIISMEQGKIWGY
jgi:hypothetical protein